MTYLDMRAQGVLGMPKSRALPVHILHENLKVMGPQSLKIE